jgi:hypothetical protein
VPYLNERRNEEDGGMSESLTCSRCGTELEPALMDRPCAVDPPYWTCEGTLLPHVRATGDAEFDEMVENLFIEQDAALSEVVDPPDPV